MASAPAPLPAAGLSCTGGSRPSDLGGQAGRLVAEHQRERAGEVGVPEGLTRADRGAEASKSPGSELAQHLHRVASDHQGDVEERPGRGPDALRVVRIHCPVGADYPSDARRLGGAQHGAEVSRVAHVRAQDDHPVACQVVERTIKERDHG